MEFDKKKIATAIMKKRRDMSMSRNELAERLCVSPDTVKRWEQGKRTPLLPDLMALAGVLETDVSRLIGEVENTVMGEGILSVLKVIDSKAAKSIIYNGIDEVISGWNAYWKEYDIIVDTSFRADENTDPEWCHDNSFLILIDKNTHDVYAIRDYGMYLPDYDDFLFKSNYIPIFTHQPMPKEELINRIDAIINTLEKEINNMESMEFPLFLVRHCGNNDYIAWSIKEQKFVCVYNYKIYRDNFGFSEIDTYDEDGIITNSKYSIIPPSDWLIKEIGLDLLPFVWERKLAWDKWEPRPEKQIKDIEYSKSTYLDAVSLINKSRKNDCGFDEEFATLEDRTARFERLCELGAPGCIIDKEIEQIKKSLLSLRNVINN